MRERLIQYVDLLFAGAANAEDMKQEILQNTLDRYDDLISQGKSEEAAYRLAITGIGDINELLSAPAREEPDPTKPQEDPAQVRKLRATAISLYIASAIPLFLLGGIGSGTLGLSLTVLLAAFATYLLLISRRSKTRTHQPPIQAPMDPRKEKVRSFPPFPLPYIYLLASPPVHGSLPG